MDTEEEDTARTPKKQKIEKERQLVQVPYIKGKKKKYMKVKGHAFQAKEYDFADTPTNSTSQFKTRLELFDK